MKSSRQTQYHDVDRGWAWPALVASYLGIMVFCNILYMGGVIYLELLARYNEGATKTSLVGALNSGMLCLVGPVAGIIINKWSCRVCIIAGSIICFVGFVVGAFMPNLESMIVVGGIVIGIGYSLNSCGLICVAGFYFQKWRDHVVSGLFAAVGIAMFSSAPIGQLLFEKYGFVSAFLMLAAIQLHLCIFGMICHPSSLEKEVHIQRKLVRSEKSGFNLYDYLDLSLMKDRAFLCFLISTIAWNFCLSVAIQHLPNYMSTLGGNANDINLIMTSFSVSNTIGRILGSVTVSNLDFKSVYVHSIVLFVSGIITTSFPLYAEMKGGAYTFAIQLGLCCGLPSSMMASIAVKYVGVTKLSESYGLAYLFSGFGVTAGPVIVGYIYSSTGSYEYSFISAGVVELIGALFGAAAIWFKNDAMAKQPIEISIEEKNIL